MEENIGDRLVEQGRVLFQSERIEDNLFTHDPDANALVNDIEHFPHAYVLACLADFQVKAEVAWGVPYHLKHQLGSFDFSVLSRQSESDIIHMMQDSGHRFWRVVAQRSFRAIRRIEGEYAGDASLIWTGSPSSAEVVYRFLEFEGMGPKIATMATNILARELKIPMSDYYSIDISVDRHIRRVFQRLGLVPDGATSEQIIFRARSLSPGFPGLLDFPCFEIGRKWCRPENPDCPDCLMRDCCPSSKSQDTEPCPDN
ncbi:MAG: iron-sulfur cluster loop [candidate division Zixibacteria bacterium]|nr:iron-sulfur cluster loop [candidate division Zixibacteria bacterium]